VWTVLGLALFLGVYYGVKRVNKEARRINHRNNLKQIYLTLSNFNDTYEGLPPAVRKDNAGRPLCSWRFQILPFLQSWMSSPIPEFGESWDSQANRYWAELGMPTYCWSSEKDSPEQFHTSVVAVTGPGTPFGHDRQIRLQDMDRATILVVEVAHSGIHWMAPEDLSLDSVPDSLVHGPDGDGFHVLFADGQIWFLSPSVPLEELQKFFTLDGAKAHDRDQVLGAYALRRR
jgi:hypothetical protein